MANKLTEVLMKLESVNRMLQKRLNTYLVNYDSPKPATGSVNSR